MAYEAPVLEITSFDLAKAGGNSCPARGDDAEL